jgi:hypothetical protein
VATRLEDDRPQATSKTPLERWASGITLQAILKYIPVASAIGIPLSFIWAHGYAVGYASYFGIPEDFVQVGPEAAVNPFVTLLAVLTFAFVVISDVGRAGFISAAKSFGSLARIAVFTWAAVYYAILLRRGESLVTLVFAALLLYVILWWSPPLISWGARRAVLRLGPIARRIGREGHRPTIAILRHFFRGTVITSESPAIMRVVLISGLCFAALVIPQGLGRWDAMREDQFTVITGSTVPEKQTLLAVYGEKAFLAHVEGRTIRTVVVKQAADLKDVQIRSERLGELRSAQ